MEEGDLLLDARNVVPGITVEGRLRRGKAQPLLYARLGVLADSDRFLGVRIGQITARVRHRGAAHDEEGGEG